MKHKYKLLDNALRGDCGWLSKFIITIKRPEISGFIFYFGQFEHSGMKKIHIVTCAFAFSSVILTSFSQTKEHQSIAATGAEGSLTLVANGEDFVRQGFVSKDGWKIDFDNVYVNISEATAYSTESSFEPQEGNTKEDIQYKDKVDLVSTSQTLDLAAGDESAEAIIVAEADVPLDFYNALSWKLDTAEADSPAAGSTIALQGTATKDGETIDFNIGLNNPTEYICGEFVGDERLGIVEASSPGKVEATLHFDHIFGDFDTPPEDALNQDALGFEPLANLASNGTLEVDNDTLSSQLSPEQYQQLAEAVTGLGHVGEGHCVIGTSE